MLQTREIFLHDILTLSMFVCLFVLDVTITVGNVVFDLPWNSSYLDKFGKGFLKFADDVNENASNV